MKNAFDIILPFISSIAGLIEDPTISEIMINGSDQESRVYIEKNGQILPVTVLTVSEAHLRVACRHIARSVGDEISDEKPILDARLPDGSRVAAMLPPCSVEGTTLTIRKFDSRRFTLPELVSIGTLSPEMAELLVDAVAARRNILISGGTGTGKTTLLNAIARLIPTEERIITIEDTAEICLAHPNLRRFEARREQVGAPAVSMGDLLRASLRHRPDRIILGEVRGGEAFDLLQALNTGHSGVISTIHANSARHALSRFTSCILQSGVELPYAAIRSHIADSIDLLLHIERREFAREVSELLHIRKYDRVHDTFEFEVVFERPARSRARKVGCND